jgi:hypothetical protein
MIQLFCLFFSFIFTSFSYSAQEPISPKSCADLRSPVSDLFTKCGSNCIHAVHSVPVILQSNSQDYLDDRGDFIHEFTAVCVEILESSLTQDQKNKSVQARPFGSTKPTGSCLKKPL